MRILIEDEEWVTREAMDGEREMRETFDTVPKKWEEIETNTPQRK